jgi:hypothetical protein
MLPGVINEISRIVEQGTPRKTSCTQLQAVASMAAAEIQNLVFRLDREEITNEVDLTACDVFVTDRTGIGKEIDLIKHGFPPVSVYLDPHDGS